MGMFDNNAGTDYIKKAISALEAVGVPNADQLTLPELQKYVSAGVLTPEQFQAIQANPDVYKQSIQETQDNTGKTAQSAALQQLGSIAQAGGSTPINEANLRNNINQTNQAMQAARGGIEQNAQERGVSNGGLSYISKLMNEQGNAQNANMGAVNAAADNARLGLSAIAQQGQLGGQMQGQANQISQAQADAAQQIAQYNNQLQNSANQYNVQNNNQAQAANLANAQSISGANTGLANQRTQYNAQVPQQVFNNQMQKASGIANVYGQGAGVAQGAQNNQNAMYGQLIGTGATVLGGAFGGPAGAAAGNQAGKKANEANMGYADGGEVQNPNERRGMDEEAGNYAKGGMCYAEGGEVHDHNLCMQVGGDVPGDETEMQPGDTEENDTVQANLSPHEIVLPRSVAQAPNAPQAAAQFVGDIKGGSGPLPQGQGSPFPGPTVNSFAEVLAKLEENGLELRLAHKGA